MISTGMQKQMATSKMEKIRPRELQENEKRRYDVLKKQKRMRWLGH